ncbi:MAG: HlyD family efflux transporter periplasmic adaptor subunit [Patescibacteria group bacterium]
MNFIERLKPWWGRKSIRGALIILLLLGIAATLFYIKTSTPPAEPTAHSLPIVEVSTAAELSNQQAISLIGTVRAFTEVAVTSERAGRLVAVNATLGQSIPAGFVIATLENASERASVLQAEGVYEAAVAASAQSTIGVSEAETTLQNAENNALTTLHSTLNTVNGAVVNYIDSFFSAPNTPIPGLKISGRGNTEFLNNERVEYQSLLSVWQSHLDTLTIENDLTTELHYAGEVVDRTIKIVDTFITVFNTQENSDRTYTDAELQTFSTNFTTLRSSLLTTQNEIDTSITELQSAADAVRRAEVAASGGNTSAADAQVKQALGSLRAAEANLAETIFRSPIAGTVNELHVRAGDFINSFTQVAKVANNNALEIVTYVGEQERALLDIGDTVIVNDGVEGKITQIAPAVDAATGKVEVRIAMETTVIKNGDTVTITKAIDAEEEEVQIVLVPLSAVKFEAENGFIFVVENSKLKAKAVTLGPIRGGSIEIENGLGVAEPFVVDARGLLDGTEVEVAS